MKKLIEGFALSKQAVRFLCIGGSITLFDWAMFVLLSRFISPSTSFIVSYTVAVLVWFLLDRRITFAVPERKLRWQLFRYFLSFGITLFINFAAFHLPRHFLVP